jgi:HSP20 family protein
MLSLIRRENSKPVTVLNNSWEPLRLVEEFLSLDPFQAFDGVSSFIPNLEVKETKKSYIIKADLPGVEEKDLDVSFEKNRLTISGKRESEKREEGESYRTYERSYGSFSRSISLPDGVDTEKVKAELKSGVLTLRLAKKPEVLPKKISVKQAV